MAPMSRRAIALYLLAALACFALGLGASRWFGGQPLGKATEPQIFIDPRSIQLLPDASLHLELPRGFDGGVP
jgi:hypothetical protein